MGLGGVTGLLATFIYPRTRKRIGLERTGLFAFSAQVTCLSLCVVSIWVPGSPSNLYRDAMPVESGNCSLTRSRSISLSQDLTSHGLSVIQLYGEGPSTGLKVSTSEDYVKTTSTVIVECLQRPYTSIILFLIGIISSRVGKKLTLFPIARHVHSNN